MSSDTGKKKKTKPRKESSTSKAKDDKLKDNQGEEEDDDELVSYNFQHLLVGPDTKVESTEYACYCGRIYESRTKFKRHLKNRNKRAMARYMEEEEGDDEEGD